MKDHASVLRRCNGPQPPNILLVLLRFILDYNLSGQHFVYPLCLLNDHGLMLWMPLGVVTLSPIPQKTPFVCIGPGDANITPLWRPLEKFLPRFNITNAQRRDKVFDDESGCVFAAVFLVGDHSCIDLMDTLGLRHLLETLQSL